MHMNGWKTVTINECCEILDSKRIPINSEDREFRVGDVPYYGANGLQGHIDGYIFNEPLILIAEDGGYFNEYSTRPIAYRIEGKSWVNNHAHVLKAKNGYCQDAIFYSLEHKDIQHFIVGGTRAKLNQGELCSITLFLPENEDDQENIVSILAKLDQAIEQTETIIAKQQRIKTGLMQDLLTKGIDENGNIRSEATHKFKDSPLGRIPVEWDVVNLQDVVHKITDGDHHTPIRNEHGVYLLSARNVLEGQIDVTNVDYVSDPEYQRMIRRCHPESGDILISCSGTIGRVCEVPKWLKCVLVRSAALIKLDQKEINSRFAEWILRSEAIQLQMLASQKKGAQPNLFQGEIALLRFAKPKPWEQENIAKILDKCDLETKNEMKILKKLKIIKLGLMQDLLTGKVRVIDIQNPTLTPESL